MAYLTGCVLASVIVAGLLGLANIIHTLTSYRYAILIVGCLKTFATNLKLIDVPMYCCTKTEHIIPLKVKT